MLAAQLHPRTLASLSTSLTASIQVKGARDDRRSENLSAVLRLMLVPPVCTSANLQSGQQATASMLACKKVRASTAARAHSHTQCPPSTTRCGEEPRVLRALRPAPGAQALGYGSASVQAHLHRPASIIFSETLNPKP